MQVRVNRQAAGMKFKVGDQVKARQEWEDIAPSGRVNAADKWGKDGAFLIDGDHRFWAAYVFDEPWAEAGSA